MFRIAYNLLIFLVFVAALLLPAGMYVAGARAQPFEEHPLTAFPGFSAKRIFEPRFYDEFSKALTDHNPARERAVILNARLSFRATGDVSGAQIVRGRDGWILLRQTVTADCREPDRIRAEVANIARLADAMHMAGIPNLFTVAADKESIYPDKLTPALRRTAVCHEKNRAVLQKWLKAANIGYFDAWDEMAALRGQTTDPVYFPDETHWSQFGSLRFAERLVKEFAPELPIAPPRQTGIETRKPDLARMAGLYTDREFPVVRFGRPAMANRNNNPVNHPGDGRPYIHNTSTSPPEAPLSRKRILFLHDSFMYVGWDQVSQYFDDTLYMHWGAMTPETFAALASVADVVVIETVERETYVRLTDFFSDARMADAFKSVTPEAKAAALAMWPRQAAPAP